MEHVGQPATLSDCPTHLSSHLDHDEDDDDEDGEDDYDDHDHEDGDGVGDDDEEEEEEDYDDKDAFWHCDDDDHHGLISTHFLQKAKGWYCFLFRGTKESFKNFHHKEKQ